MASESGQEAKIVSLQSAAGRSVTSWIDEFSAEIGDVVSPAIFCKWGAIACIAGALESKVWVMNKKGPLKPNLYITLVGQAAAGKTEVIRRVRSYWETLESHHLASSSVTRASLIDELHKATRSIVTKTLTPVNFHSLLIASNELGVLLPAYDTHFMNTLQDLYDNFGYSESRRTGNLELKMKHTCLTFLAGCTPNYLKDTLPPGAWDQGFISRTFMIYAGVQPLAPLFLEDEEDQFKETSLNDKLVRRLREISELYGPFSVTKEARVFFNKWYTGGQKPLPEHPRLTSYSARRGAHLIKLAMIASVDRGNSLEIDLNDFHRALEWMVEAEFYMPDIFKAMTSGGDSMIIQDTYQYIWTLYKQEKKPVAEHRVVRFLTERVPAHSVVKIIENMLRMKVLDMEMVAGVGNAYKPKLPPKE
jgi:hypothetical protein